MQSNIDKCIGKSQSTHPHLRRTSCVSCVGAPANAGGKKEAEPIPAHALLRLQHTCCDGRRWPYSAYLTISACVPVCSCACKRSLVYWFVYAFVCNWADERGWLFLFFLDSSSMWKTTLTPFHLISMEIPEVFECSRIN